MKILLALILGAALSAPPSSWGAADAARPAMVVQTGHTTMVEALAFTPDGKFLVTGGSDDNARLWNAATGEELRTFGGHAGSVHAVAATPDGRFAVTGSYDKTARLWDLATGETIRTFVNAADVYSLAVSPDGRTLVTGGEDGIVKIWDLASGALTRSLAAHARNVGSIAISRDGRYFATGGWDNVAKLWDLATGAELRSFSHDKNVYAVAISPDGGTLLTASEDGTVKLWEIPSGRELRTLKPDQFPEGAAFTPDGLSAVIGTIGGGAEVWRVEDGVRTSTFSVGQPHLVVSPDGRAIAVGAYGEADLLALPSGELIRRFKGRSASVDFVALSPDGRTAALGGRYDDAAELWDVATGETRRLLKGHSNVVWSLAFSPDGKRLITGGADGHARIWDAATGKALKDYAQDEMFVGTVAMSPDRKLFVTSSHIGTVELVVHRTADGAAVKTFTAPLIAGFGSAGFSPDGKTLAFSVSNSVQLWSVAAWTQLATFPGYAAAFSRDGARIATANGNDAKLWDAATGRELRTFTGHTAAVTSVSFSADGRLLVTSAFDRTARLWDVETGREVRIMRGHTGGVSSAALTPNGKLLVTAGGDDGTTRIWDAATGAELVRRISLDDGWVVVTPDGYFDGSPAGMKSIHWTAGLQTFPLEAFSEGYYVPGLLARLIAGEKVGEAKSLSQGFALPPLVKIVSPAGGGSWASEEIDVTVRATDQGGGVDEIRLYQNGKALGSDARGMKSTALEQTFRVVLAEGSNALRAVALSRDRIEGNPDEISVALKGPEKQATLHVVAVGVNKYKNGALDLNYARPDAKALSDFFAAQPRTLFKSVERRELFDADATKAGILAALADLKSAAPQDVVVIYLAGHGESLGSAWYFVPYDLVYPERDEQVKEKALSSAELVAAVGNVRAQKVLILLDACKSGEAMLAFAGRGLEDRKALLQLARAAGVHVMAASTKDQIASEVKELGHGVFTYALLKGLKGEADARKTGTVTVSALLTYVENELPEISRKYRSEAQYPVRDERGQDFPIATDR